MTDIEYFDICDEAGRFLGVSRPRADVHAQGYWHRGVHLWLYTPERGLIFQKRSMIKDTWPGRLAASVGGHYKAGEGIEGLAREAHEELGITLDISSLIPLGTRRIESVESGIIDREIQDIYLTMTDLPLTSFRLDPDEVDALVLLSVHDAVLLHREKQDVRGIICERGSTQVRPGTWTGRDVIPDWGAYLAGIAAAIAEINDGTAPTQRTF